MTHWTCPTCGAHYQAPTAMPVAGPLASCRNRGCPGQPQPRR